MLVLSRIDYRWLRLVSVPSFLAAWRCCWCIVLARPWADFPARSAARRAGCILGSRSPPLVHPAEFAKLALVIYLAHWLARAATSVGEPVPRHRCRSCVIAGRIILLVAIEPDLGTTGRHHPRPP